MLGRRPEVNAVLATRFLEVANLIKSPPALREPRMVLRVWKAKRAPTSVRRA
jgi:hypothetical protein